MSDIVELREQVSALRGEVEMLQSKIIESNAIVRVERGDAPTDGPIPVEPLLVLNGKLNGVSVRVLKDDGCNTNVISQSFLDRYRKTFEVHNFKTLIKHSRDRSAEESSEVVMNATLNMQTHSYRSNWVFADCRYDVLFGMPWNVANNPRIDYTKRVVQVPDARIVLEDKTEKEREFP